MNIKSLLLGSAAALAVVSGAQAADAIVAAEPEPAEYVKVCDAFGTGYFYIPGTETCLNISGWARYQVDLTYDSTADEYGWDAKGLGFVALDAKSDSEFGTIEGYIGINVEQSSVNTDEAFLKVGGFKAGLYYSWLDSGLNGETDSLGEKTRFVSASYTFEGEGFSAGVALDELNDTTHDAGLEAKLGASVGGVSADLIGYYDTAEAEGGVRAVLGAEAGPGTFQLAGLYNSGANGYYAKTEWAVAAAYAIKATDALTVTPAAQYTENLDGTDGWKAGVTVDYTLAAGLTTKTSVQYNNADDAVTGFFRIQRSF